MNDFPIYQVPYLGNGMTIGMNAIIHVIFSHGLAIGVFTMIVYAEYLGNKYNSPIWEKFAKDFIRPIIIIITGVSAVTGVGIWFTISALAPRGTGSMLRVFFWPWFIEWIVFAAEVVVILIYYFRWDKMSEKNKRGHINLGFYYTLLAMLSGVLITGILGFMLTSDGWVWDKNFFSAFFNPSFFPQLLLRYGIAFLLGSVFTIAYLLYKNYDRDFKKAALRKFSKVTLISLIISLLSAVWYFYIVPSTFKIHSVFAITSSHFSGYTDIFWIINILFLIILFFFIAISLIKKDIFARRMIIPIAIITILFVAEFERIREFIRGPYLMPGYMYANQILLEEEPVFSKEGILKKAFWYNMIVTSKDVNKEGLYLFGKNCSVCHTIGGLNDIKERVDERSLDGIYVITGNLERMVPFMPPFSGTDDERRILSGFLYKLANDKIKINAPSEFINENIEEVKGGK